MSSLGTSRASSVQLPERQPGGTSPPPIESIDLTEINVEIPETQRSADSPLPASQDKRTKLRSRKRKVSAAQDDEELERSKRSKVQNVQEISLVRENQPGVETETFVRLLDEILAHEEELKKANETIEKNGQIIETLFRANNLLGKRLARAESLIQDLDRKHSEAIQSLRADLNSTDGQVRTIKTDRDDTINALTKVVNGYIIPWSTNLR